jgi:DHA1 family multidrug resistance protein-like MFS transporter
MPVIFYVYGKKIRAKSKFAPAQDIEQEKKRDEESRGESSESETANGSGDVSAGTEAEKVRKRTE